MPTRNVDLTEHLDRFIESGVTSGRFNNPSKVVREGLRLLEQREREDESKIEWLRAAAKEGFDELDRDEGTKFNSVEDLHACVDQIGTDVTSEITATLSVAKNRSSPPALPPPALQDIRDVLRWSEETFAKTAAGRYRALIQ